ncbi:TPA: hypothetical protein ACGG78_001286 [Vibrio cholerae]|nr:hypothetical protein [Vibrio cholerae]MDV2335579.1 hypothetical protein [Vibrio cholerae]
MSERKRPQLLIVFVQRRSSHQEWSELTELRLSLSGFATNGLYGA